VTGKGRKNEKIEVGKALAVHDQQKLTVQQNLTGIPVPGHPDPPSHPHLNNVRYGGRMLSFGETGDNGRRTHRLLFRLDMPQPNVHSLS